MLRKDEKTTTDLDLEKDLSAKPDYVNHCSKQPYFVKNLPTTISKFSPLENLPFLFVPKMSIEMLVLTQDRTTNLCTCRE